MLVRIRMKSFVEEFKVMPNALPVRFLARCVQYHRNHSRKPTDFYSIRLRHPFF